MDPYLAPGQAAFELEQAASLPSRVHHRPVLPPPPEASWIADHPPMHEIEIREMTRDLSRKELEYIAIRLSQTNQPSDVSISALLEGVEPISEISTKEPVDTFGRQLCDRLTRLEGFNSDPNLGRMAEYGQETNEMLGRIVKGVITDVEPGFQRAEIYDHDVIELWTNGIAALIHTADALLEYKVLVNYFSRQEVVERIKDGMMCLTPMVLRLDSATHYSTELYKLWFNAKVLDQEYERSSIDGFKAVRERVCEVLDMADVDVTAGMAKSRNGSGSTGYMLPAVDNVKKLPRDINCPPDIPRPTQSSLSDVSTETGNSGTDGETLRREAEAGSGEGSEEGHGDDMDYEDEGDTYSGSPRQ